jgi:hypothetical protein
MLIFIGGAARAGKSMLVRRLLAEERLPYLNLDIMKMGIVRGLPEYRLDPNAGAVAVAERLWPLVREMSVSLLVDRVDYVFEGELLPRHVAALAASHPGRITACFVGYASIPPERKLAQIRAHGGLPNDWPSEYVDAALLAIIRREIAFSQLVRDECAACNVRYFDCSADFLATQNAAIAYLREALSLE